MAQVPLMIFKLFDYPKSHKSFQRSFMPIANAGKTRFCILIIQRLILIVILALIRMNIG